MTLLLLMNEQGMPASREGIARLRSRRERFDIGVRCAAIAQALADDDNAALAAAIDEAERHNLVVHAARVRIVLAQRTGDRSHLARARPVLERLRDRMALRRLEEVAASIG
jgi:hypothetical protein